MNKREKFINGDWYIKLTPDQKYGLVCENWKTIKNTISEHKAISDEVVFITKNICNTIFQQFSVLQYDVYPNALVGKEGSFEYNQHGICFNVSWKLLERNEKPGVPNITNVDAETIHDTKTLNITAIATRGHWEYQRIYEAVQHEISHLFEITKRGKPYSNIENYNVAVGILEYLKSSKPSRTIKEKEERLINYVVANIIYFSYEFEHRAYVNGAYQYLIQHHANIFNFEELLEYTHLFQRFSEFELCYKILDKTPSDDENLINALKSYHNVSYPKLIKASKRTIVKVSLAIKRLKDKIREDMTVNEVHINGFDYYPLTQPEKYGNNEPIEPYESFLKKRFLL